MNRLERSQTSVEVMQPENNFQRFINENYEVFDNLNSANTEFRKEDQGRRKDPIVDELAQGYLNIAAVSPRLNITISRGAFRQVIEQAMFDDINISKGEYHNAFDKFYKYLSPQQTQELNDLRLRMGEVQDEYKEAVGSLREERDSAWQATHGAFVDYLSGSTDNLAHFGNFLIDPNLRRDRETVGPFLHRLAQNVHKGKPENYFDQAISMWKEKNVSQANQVVLRQYLEAELKRAKESSSNGSAFFSGLMFGIEMGRASHVGSEAEEISQVDVILDYLKTNPWPEVVSSGYKRVLDANYSLDIRNTRTALDQYRRVGEKFITGGEVFSQKDHKRRNKNGLDKNGASVEKREENETEKEYEVGVLHQRETGSTNESRFEVDYLNSDTLEEYLEKRANKISPHDKRMLDDVKSMVESLRSNPYGFGTKNTVDRTVTIERKKYKLRELMPGKRGSDLSLSHVLSRDVRVSYVIDNKNNFVLIEDIDTHTAFDRKLRKGI